MKRKIKQFILLVSLFIGLFLVGQVRLAQAQYVPQPYGEIPPAGQIFVDKKIYNPEAEKGVLDEWVDNLGPQDYHFSPGEDVSFKIKVKNTGETTLEKVKVTDTLPPYVELVSGSLEVEYQNLELDESEDFEILVKVVPADKIPNDQGLYCLINKVEVVADDQTDEDTAQLCIEKKVLGAAVQPEVGADLWLLGLGFLGISTLGFFLKVRKRH